MIRTSILAAAAALAGLMATGASAQPADPNYQAQVQDYQARQRQYQQQLQAHDHQQEAYDAQRDAYATQRAGYAARQVIYDDQRRLYLLGRAQYEAKYGPGSYDEYTRTHTTTTTVVSPVGHVESRSRTTVITHH